MMDTIRSSVAKLVQARCANPGSCIPLTAVFGCVRKWLDSRSIHTGASLGIRALSLLLLVRL